MKCFNSRVVRSFPILLTAVVILSTAGSALLKAATIFESGTLGPTGVTRSDIANETVRGTNVRGAVFVGVRFFIDQPVITTQIGGHFIKNTGADESFFGAIVGLNDQDDFPNSSDLSTSDVVGSTLLAFPELSDEVYGDLTKSLDPGWYALVFGSGLFGAAGSGGAVRNGVDIGDPAYIGFQPGSGWVNVISSFFDNHRFVIKGSIVPEPATFMSTCIGFLFYLLRWRSNRRR